jgi:hypothetical protein
MRQPNVPGERVGLHRADALVLALLSSALFAVGLLLLREVVAGRLNRLEVDAVVAAGIAFGLIQLWLSFRAVLAMCLWAASGMWAHAPWTLPVWWLGTLPGAWLGLVFPGEQDGLGFFVVSLGLLAGAAHGLTHAVHALEVRALGVSRGR